MDTAQRDFWAANNAHLRASRWQRPGAARRLTRATEALDSSRGRYEEIKTDLAPILDELSQARTAAEHAETSLRSSQARARIDSLVTEPRSQTPEHGMAIEL